MPIQLYELKKKLIPSGMDRFIEIQDGDTPAAIIKENDSPTTHFLIDLGELEKTSHRSYFAMAGMITGSGYILNTPWCTHLEFSSGVETYEEIDEACRYELQGKAMFCCGVSTSREDQKKIYEEYAIEHGFWKFAFRPIVGVIDEKEVVECVFTNY